MAELFTEVSTITAKGQTTVPKAIRQALGVDYGGRIAFRVNENGVSVERADREEADPAIDGFLTLLARDLEARPEAIAVLPESLARRIEELTGDVAVGVDEPIQGEVDL